MTMTTTNNAMPMPTATEIESAMNVLDRLICAAEDEQLVGSDTLGELMTAYTDMEHLLRYTGTPGEVQAARLTPWRR